MVEDNINNKKKNKQQEVKGSRLNERITAKMAETLPSDTDKHPEKAPAT